MENHRSLVSSLTFGDSLGYEGLTKFYIYFKSNTAEYFKIAYTGDIKNSNVASHYPIAQMRNQIENIEQLYSNIYHLISLIREKINDDKFYHEIFYNSLSKAEKYILGMYVLNEKYELWDYFNNSKFNYLEYFVQSGNSFFNKKTVPYFPDLHFTFYKNWTRLSIPETLEGRTDPNFGFIKIAVNNNEYDHSIVLNKIVLEFNWRKENFSFSLDFNQSIDQQPFDFYELITSQIFTRCLERFRSIRSDLSFDFMFSLIFVIHYNGKIFNYSKRFTLDASNADEFGADINLRDHND